MRYQLIDHTADIGIRLNNKTIKGIFEDAAFALFDILCDIKTVQAGFERAISVEALNPVRTVHPGGQRGSGQASDYEELLNEFLSMLLREFTVENNLISKVEIQDIRTENAPTSVGTPLRYATRSTQDAQHLILSAIISGEPYDPARHSIKTEIKAVTFHNLTIKKTKPGYTAEVIFDV
jgi:SHS2 domain-containing protein